MIGAFGLLRPRRSVDYAEYSRDLAVPGPVSLMPAILWETHEPPRIRPAEPGAPAPQPYQPGPALAYVAPVAPAQPPANPGPVPWEPAAPGIQTYEFLRAPTAMEAIIGPQYNPARLLGLEG